jgi:hypothetical protein
LEKGLRVPVGGDAAITENQESRIRTAGQLGLLVKDWLSDGNGLEFFEL